MSRHQKLIAIQNLVAFECIIRQCNFIVGKWNKIEVNTMVFIHGAFKKGAFERL